MDKRIATARVRRIVPQQTLLQRMRLARPIAFAAAVLLFSFPLVAQRRRQAVLHLREDVSSAMSHVTLNGKQTQKLDRCRQTLLLAAQSGKARKTVTPADLDRAVNHIDKISRSAGFQDGDRERIRQDIDELRAIERRQNVRRVRARL